MVLDKTGFRTYRVDVDWGLDFLSADSNDNIGRFCMTGGVHMLLLI